MHRHKITTRPHLQRDDGEYQLLSGYRRRRASELAKKPDIPAHVYEMTMQEAIAYRKAVKNNPNAPIPGKLLDPSTDMGKGTEAPAVPGEKGTPTVAELEAQAKSGQPISLTDLANADKAEREAQKGGTAETDPPGQDKGEGLTAAKEGPAGTAITQIFEKRLTVPDEAARKTLPTPKEGESYFITLHPAYLEKSSYTHVDACSVKAEMERLAA